MFLINVLSITIICDLSISTLLVAKWLILKSDELGVLTLSSRLAFFCDWWMAEGNPQAVHQLYLQHRVQWKIPGVAETFTGITYKMISMPPRAETDHLRPLRTTTSKIKRITACQKLADSWMCLYCTRVITAILNKTLPEKSFYKINCLPRF